MKIGVFDSGFGGLQVFGGFIKKLPEYDFLYLGDSARAPYGDLSQEIIYKYTEQAVDFLFNKDCELVILACNTASSKALRKIQQEYLLNNYPNRRVLGVIIPASEIAIKNDAKKIGIIATESSVSSKSFIRELKKLKKGVKIFQQACPLLVPFIESGNTSPDIIDSVLKNYLTPLVEKKIDTLILGCTHYGLLKKQIAETLKKLGSAAQIIDESETLPDKLSNYLWRHPEIEEKLSKNSKRKYFTTKDPEKIEKIGSQIIGEEISAVNVKLG